MLAADGVSTDRMYALDHSMELWELGYKLFLDRDKMEATFVHASIFGDADRLQPIAQDSPFDVIIACQFLHLFSFEEQLSALRRIVAWTRPGSVIMGYQRGQPVAREYEKPWGRMFFHNLESFGGMWTLVESDTGTKWAIEKDLVDLEAWGLEKEDTEWMPPDCKGLNFVCTRVR